MGRVPHGLIPTMSLDLAVSGWGFKSAPIPLQSLRGGAQCGQDYAGAQVAAIDPRYKFSTGLRGTGGDLEKNENRPYSVKVK
jgi:hypothetical protein